MTAIKDAVAHIRRQAAADASPYTTPVDRDLLDMVLTAADLAVQIEGMAMGQAYQIVGRLFAALDNPTLRPSEADEERVLNYLSAGSYSDGFLPWPGGAD